MIQDEKAAEKLRNLADNMQSDIDDKFSLRQVHTARYLRMAHKAADEGLKLYQAQQAMYLVAAHMNVGTLEDRYAHLTTKKAFLKGVESGDELVMRFVPNDLEIPKELKIHLLRGELEQEGFKDLFPTPQSVRDVMQQHCHILPGDIVLEPSAGLGDLALWLVEQFDCEVDTIEIQPRLSNILKGMGFPPIWSDFLTFKADKEYDAVVMNPPFSKDEWAAHVIKAWEVVKPTGFVYAVLPSSAKFKDTKKLRPFREIADDHGEFFALPDNAFMENKAARTGVSTVLLRLEKPEQTEEPDHDPVQMVLL